MPVENVPNQSVERAAALLQAMADDHRALRASDLATAAGVGLSTASRLLATLESLRFVERDPATSTYRLGAVALSIGGAAANQSPVYREARQHMQNLASSLGLGVNLAQRQDDHLQYLFNTEGWLAPRSFTLTGTRNPLHATGLGKSLLAGLDAASRRALLTEESLTAFTARTLTTHDALDAAVNSVLDRGYGTEVEELARGRACVAAPIRDRSNDVVAAVSISGPLSAVNLDTRQDELGQAVVELADTISIALGYRAVALPLHAMSAAAEESTG
ncbi:MAG: IclR family transcriptional regulator [Jatrophihabitans sp.]